MEETGTVIEDRGLTAVIRTEKKSSCDSCSSKSSCHIIGEDDVLIEADNPVGAHVGDHVVFTVRAGSILKAGVLLYLVPVLLFIFGIVIGPAVGSRFFPETNTDLVSGLLGVGFLIIAFVGLKLYSRSLERDRSHMPRILRVV